MNKISADEPYGGLPTCYFITSGWGMVFSLIVIGLILSLVPGVRSQPFMSNVLKTNIRWMMPTILKVNTSLITKQDRRSDHDRYRHYHAYHCMRNRFWWTRSEEHTSELQSRFDLVCRLLLEKKNKC